MKRLPTFKAEYFHRRLSCPIGMAVFHHLTIYIFDHYGKKICRTKGPMHFQLCVGADPKALIVSCAAGQN